MKQSLEERKIASLTKRYEREGYRVMVEPRAPDMRYRPDLALRRGHELVLIEVVSAKSSKEKQAAIEYLAKYAKEIGARFDLVVTNPRPKRTDRQGRNSRLLRLLRERISTELDATAESNRGAFVILCSALVENLLQGLFYQESVPSTQGLSMVGLAKRLRQKRIISDSAARFVHELWSARNSVVHWGMPYLRKNEIDNMRDKTRNLLKNYGREPNVT